MSNLPIGVFDSGCGGLTVLSAIRTILPRERIIYFGDTAHLPYGNKSEQTILRYTLDGCAFLINQGIKTLVIACNTACSASAVEHLQRRYPHLPVLGVVSPAIEHIISSSPSKRMAILATRATISSGMYQKLLSEKIPDVTLFALCCPLFVPLVEEGHIDHPLAQMAAHEYLHALKEKHIDAALLACTHYPLLKQVIQKELGPQVSLIDPAVACAQTVKQTLEHLSLLNPEAIETTPQFFVSDDPDKFRLLSERFLRDC